MGAVYVALDERLGRRVAVKQVLAQAGADPRKRQRFRREASTLARLSHPAIVQIFDVIDTGDGDWIVMELVEGPTVAQLAADGPLDVDQALAIGRQVAEGLAEAHDQGVLHRDLKAENVMLNRAGHAKILDFGLAKALWGEEAESALSVSGQVLGTPRAMSPEQARGLPLDARSDLFSLGVLLYEMVTAARPFSGATPLDTLTRITSHPHLPAREANPATPLRLSALIDQLLEKSPELRPTSARVVAAALAGLEADLREATANETMDLPQDSEPTLEPASVPDLPEAAFESRSAESSSASYRAPTWRRHGRTALLALVPIVVLAVIVGRGSWRGDAETPAGVAAEPGSYELFREGMAHLGRFDEADHLDKAITSFEAALAVDENSAPAHAGLSMAYRQQYVASRDALRLEQAITVAERAVALDEHLALARVALGTAYSRAGRYQEALGQLETALQLEPSNAEAYRGLGRAHCQG